MQSSSDHIHAYVSIAELLDPWTSCSIAANKWELSMMPWITFVEKISVSVLYGGSLNFVEDISEEPLAPFQRSEAHVTYITFSCFTSSVVPPWNAERLTRLWELNVIIIQAWHHPWHKRTSIRVVLHQQETDVDTS